MWRVVDVCRILVLRSWYENKDRAGIYLGYIETHETGVRKCSGNRSFYTLETLFSF